MKTALGSLLLGVFFGASLHHIGFGDWDEVHAMFTFADLRLVLTFGLAVVLLVAGFAVLRTLGKAPEVHRPIHRGTVVGALLFGVGWALTGSCPSIVLVQLGQGELGALASLAGIVVGNALFAVVNPRFLHVPNASCSEP